MRRCLPRRSGLAVLAVACVVATGAIPAAQAADRPAKVWAGVGMTGASRAESPFSATSQLGR